MKKPNPLDSVLNCKNSPWEGGGCPYEKNKTQSAGLCANYFVLQEGGGMRGSPLAMLAAQCNKLSSMSPPPLADAAVGKGFHPWKKSAGTCQSVTGSSPEGRRQLQHQQPDSPGQSTANSSSSSASTVTTTAATAPAYSPAPQYGTSQMSTG